MRLLAVRHRTENEVVMMHLNYNCIFRFTMHIDFEREKKKHKVEAFIHRNRYCFEPTYLYSTSFYPLLLFVSVFLNLFFQSSNLIQQLLFFRSDQSFFLPSTLKSLIYTPMMIYMLALKSIIQLMSILTSYYQ